MFQLRGIKSAADLKVHHFSSLRPLMLLPQPEVLLASDGAVGLWSTGGAAPGTAEGVDEVVQAEKPWRSETEQPEGDLSASSKGGFFPTLTWRAVAWGGGVQRKQKHQQRARGATDLHGYGTTAEEQRQHNQRPENLECKNSLLSVRNDNLKLLFFCLFYFSLLVGEILPHRPQQPITIRPTEGQLIPGSAKTRLCWEGGEVKLHRNEQRTQEQVTPSIDSIFRHRKAEQTQLNQPEGQSCRR